MVNYLTPYYYTRFFMALEYRFPEKCISFYNAKKDSAPQQNPD
jgi:hypothetical protein